MGQTMKLNRRAAVLGSAALLAGCSTGLQRNSGPEVTRLLVYKDSRRLYLMHHDETLEFYDFDLGFAPEGHKQIEGDGRTPEGHYLIDRRNPQSQFHLSIGISYPNARDRARAAAMGKSPGGDIFIHGQPNAYVPEGRDWTAGCIAVKNREMDAIYAMVQDGTPISIFP